MRQSPDKYQYDHFLDRLTADGWSYGILDWVDLVTGQRYWQLDARRGEEMRIWRVKVEDLGMFFGNMQTKKGNIPNFPAQMATKPR